MGFSFHRLLLVTLMTALCVSPVAAYSTLCEVSQSDCCGHCDVVNHDCCCEEEPVDCCIVIEEAEMVYLPAGEVSLPQISSHDDATLNLFSASLAAVSCALETQVRVVAIDRITSSSREYCALVERFLI